MAAMSIPFNPIAANPLDVDTDPPPQELTWDSTIRDLFAESYVFSDDLLAAAPRFIRMYADRWQINWQESGIPDPEAQTVVDVFITVRPVAPASIILKV
jgi:hypothetical protein